MEKMNWFSSWKKSELFFGTVKIASFPSENIVKSRWDMNAVKVETKLSVISYGKL
jgi:hypothetical protein